LRGLALNQMEQRSAVGQKLSRVS